MLTFLRKIRKSLIDLGSTRKYLLYAIGEIALVVIGILIALQINNWNENQKSVRVENELVKALTTEIKENKRYISNYANRYLARVDSIGKIMLNNFGQKSNLMSADTFDIYLEKPVLFLIL